MNELKNMCTQVRPAEPRALAEGRRRLTSLARGDEQVRARRPYRTWVVSLATATGLAVTAGIVAVAQTGSGAKPGPAHAGGPTTHAGGGSLGEVRLVSATQVLDQAAAAARLEPDLNPRADQFIHITSAEFTTAGRKDRELWLSVDGRKDGVLRMSPCFGREQSHCDIPLAKGPAQFTPAYYRTLPTDPAKLTAWFRSDARGGRPLDQLIWKDIESRVIEQYVPPKLRAAMFTVAATIPGVHLVTAVKDPAGRDGVGVYKTIDGVQEQMVFDRQTFRFLGLRHVNTRNPGRGWSSVLLGVSVDDTAPIVHDNPVSKKPKPSKSPG